MPAHPADPPPSPVDLVPLVRELAADEDAWRPYVRFDRATRHWARLPSPAGVDVWLLTWLPDQGTDLHDHGTSAAALTVVHGGLVEVRAGRDGTLTPLGLGTGATHWVAPGVVHDVVNRSAAPAVSIHAYSPRLTTMTFWAARRGRLVPTRTVHTDEPEVAA